MALAPPRILHAAALAALSLAILTISVSVSHADESASAIARDAYDKGMAHYHLEEFDAAVSEWERGFRAKPAAEFLYNIAQAYRLGKRPDKALSFYQKYLRLSPAAKNRAEVDRHIASLKEIVEKQKALAESPPQQPLPSAAAPEPVSGAPVAHADLVARPTQRPVYKKPWFWGVVGGVAAVAVAGMVVGIVLGTRDNVQSLGDARF